MCVSSAHASLFGFDPTDEAQVRDHCSMVGMSGEMGNYSDVDACFRATYKQKPAPPQNVIDKYAQKLMEEAIAVNVALIEYTKVFFVAMGAIGIVWSFYGLLFKEPSFNAFLYEVIRVMLTIGFFWFLITELPVELIRLGQGFVDFADTVGNKAHLSGLNGSNVVATGASDILSNGFNLAGTIFKTISWTDALNFMIFVKGGCCLCIMVISFLIALNWTLAFLQFWFTSCIGVYLLGFAPTPWTRDTALNFLKSIVAQSFSLFVRALCLCIVSLVLSSYATDIGSTATSGAEMDYVYNCLNLALSIYMGYVLCDKLPDTLGGLIAPVGSAKANVMGAMISSLALAGGVAGGASRLGGSLLGRGASGVMGALRSK